MNALKIYAALLACLLVTQLRANPELAGGKPLTVNSLSNDRIHNHKVGLLRLERNRNAIKGLGMIAAFTASSVAITHWFSKDAQPKASEEDLDALKDRVISLEKRNKKEDKKDENKEDKSKGKTKKDTSKETSEPSWGKWFKGKAFNVGIWAKSLGTGVAISMIRSYLMKEAGKVFWPVVPQFGRYLFESPTMIWSMTKHSKFIDSITALCNWTRTLLNEPDSPRAQKELVVCTNQFVLEMEKILAHMAFVKERLKSSVYDENEFNDLAFYGYRAEQCMTSCAEDVERLVATVRTYASLGKDHQEKTRSMIETMHKILFSIICQLEAFEPVVHAAGYEDESEKDIFASLKGYVMPRWKTIALQTENYDDETEWLKDMAMDIINQAI